MDFPTLTINENTRLLYISKEFYKKIGRQVTAVPNGSAILLYKENMNLAELLASIDSIRSDIVYTMEKHNKGNGQK